VRDNLTRTNNAVESFHVALRRRVKVAHPNLYTFLGHLQRATADGETDIARPNRGMSLRRSKKRTNLINEARIKDCISRFDSGAYTRAQFLRAVSHSVGARGGIKAESLLGHIIRKALSPLRSTPPSLPFPSPPLS